MRKRVERREERREEREEEREKRRERRERREERDRERQRENARCEDVMKTYYLSVFFWKNPTLRHSWENLQITTVSDISIIVPGLCDVITDTASYRRCYYVFGF